MEKNYKIIILFFIILMCCVTYHEMSPISSEFCRIFIKRETSSSRLHWTRFFWFNYYYNLCSIYHYGVS